MTVSLIYAQNEQGAIGCQGNHPLPWHFPEDLKHFKALTHGRALLMGKATYASLPGLLPGRHHVVLSTDPSYLKGQIPDDAPVEVHGTFDEALAAALNHFKEPDVFVIGGARVLNEAVHCADVIYRTCITGVRLDSDRALAIPTWVNALIDRGEFVLTESHAGIDSRLTFETWRRR